MQECFKEYDDISPKIIEDMRNIEQSQLLKLYKFIRKEDVARQLWTKLFNDIEYTNFDELTRDDIIYFFLTLEDNMMLKPPGIWKIVKS